MLGAVERGKLEEALAMGMFAAIARVRAGAKQAGLEGALASIGDQLKSDAIPERLRDAASRLASLLGSSSTSAAARAEASKAAAPPSASDGDTASSAERRFGADADVSVAGAGAAEPRREPPPVGSTEPSSEPARDAALVEGPAAGSVAPQASERVFVQTEAETKSGFGATREADAKPQRSKAGASAAASPTPAPTKQRTRDGRKPARSGPAVPREKNKEKLAGEASVEKTSARSAARPAAKRPRSKKKKSSGL